MRIGDRVRLIEDNISKYGKSYYKGHEFTVYGSSYRGVDLIDDNGNKLDECLFIHDKLEVIKDKTWNAEEVRLIVHKALLYVDSTFTSEDIEQWIENELNDIENEE